MSTILERRLLIGEYPTPDDVAWLRDVHAVDAVLSLQDDFDLTYKSIDAAALARAYEEAGIPLRRIGIVDGDSEDLFASLSRILEALHGLVEDGKCVYVHCNAGFNRAPTVAIAYLRAHHGLSVEKAHAEVKARRACAPYLTVVRRYFGDPEG